MPKRQTAIFRWITRPEIETGMAIVHADMAPRCDLLDSVRMALLADSFKTGEAA